MNIESVKLLRDKAEQNIKEYCTANRENYIEVKNDLINEADEFNVLLPVDFYIKYYNLSLELNN